MVHRTMEDVIDKIILHTGDVYVLYNQYAITTENDTVRVYRRGDGKEFIFNRRRHAVVWAILDSNYKFYEANRVRQLDHQLESIKVDKEIHAKLRKRGTLDQSLINTIKLQNDTDRQQRFVNEMHKYIKVADICHQRGIKNELNRTSRK